MEWLYCTEKLGLGWAGNLTTYLVNVFTLPQSSEVQMSGLHTPTGIEVRTVLKVKADIPERQATGHRTLLGSCFVSKEIIRCSLKRVRSVRVCNTERDRKGEIEVGRERDWGCQSGLVTVSRPAGDLYLASLTETRRGEEVVSRFLAHDCSTIKLQKNPVPGSPGKQECAVHGPVLSYRVKVPDGSSSTLESPKAWIRQRAQKNVSTGSSTSRRRPMPVQLEPPRRPPPSLSGVSPPPLSAARSPALPLSVPRRPSPASLHQERQVLLLPPPLLGFAHLPFVLSEYYCWAKRDFKLATEHIRRMPPRSAFYALRLNPLSPRISNTTPRQAAPRISYLMRNLPTLSDRSRPGIIPRLSLSTYDSDKPEHSIWNRQREASKTTTAHRCYYRSQSRN